MRCAAEFTRREDVTVTRGNEREHYSRQTGQFTADDWCCGRWTAQSGQSAVDSPVLPAGTGDRYSYGELLTGRGAGRGRQPGPVAAPCRRSCRPALQVMTQRGLFVCARADRSITPPPAARRLAPLPSRPTRCDRVESADNQRPATSDQRPATSNQRPVTGDQ